MVIGPVAQVAAQEGSGYYESEPSGSGAGSESPTEDWNQPQVSEGSGDTSGPETPTTDPDPTLEPTIPDTTPEDETPTDPSEDMPNGSGSEPAAAFGVGTPADGDNGTIAGATKDRSISSPRVDKSSGALVQSYPFALPQGRGGLTPDLSLNYSSNNTDNFSISGYGWAFSFPSIERINKMGVDKLYSTDYYAASDAGELASSSASNTLTQGTYMAKNGRGEVITYVFNNNIWTVETKDGTTYRYGETDASRLSNADGTKVAAWYVSSVTDANGNSITYTYEKDTAKVYPKTISYSGAYEVEFAKESRSDAMTSYAMGFPVTSNYRINKVSVKVKGMVRRVYDIKYSAGVNGVRSLLASITETGISDKGKETIMPATTFEYENSSINFVKDPKFGTERITNAVFTADFDANGIMDAIGQGKSFFTFPTRIVTQHQNYGFWGYFGYYQNSECQPNHQNCPPRYERAVGQRLFDVNNDQKVDWFIGRRFFPGQTYLGPNHPESFDFRININASTGACCMNFTTPSTAAPMKAFETSPRWNENFYTQAVLANLNGDPFLESISREFSVDRGKSLPNLWEDFDLNNRYIIPAVFRDSYKLTESYGIDLVTVDLNADGLDDLIGTSTMQHLNGGDPSRGAATWIETTSFTKNNDKYLVPVDINGDGLVDFAKGRNSQFDVYINTGTGLKPETVITMPCSVESECSSVLVDMTGDGMVDSLPYVNQAKRPDMLKKIISPMGGTTAVEYEPTPQHVDPITNDQLHPKLPSILYTVKKITTDPGFGQPVTTVTYTYNDGKNYDDPADAYKHRFAGFATITEKQSDESYTKTYYHQGDGVNTDTAEPTDNVALIGLPYREDRYDASKNKVLTRTVTTYTVVNRGGDMFSVYPKDTLSNEFGAGTAQRSKVQTSYFNTDTGLPVKIINWGEVTETQPRNGSYVDTGTDSLTKNFIYATSTNGKVLALAQEELIGATGARAAKTTYYYDLLPFGQVTKGNITTIEQQKDTSGALIKSSKTYNTYGQVLTETDANNHTTTYEYDDGEYSIPVRKITNALNQSTTYANYDHMCGKSTSKQNPNTSTSFVMLDGFCRTLEAGSTDATGNTPTKISYTYTDTPLSVSVEEKTWLSATHSVSNYTYVDGFGRTLQTKRQAEGGKWVTNDTVYDAMGRVVKTSLPYFSNTSAREAAIINPSLYTEYQYDSLNRTIRVKNILGSTLMDYYTNVWSVTTTDANNKKKTLEKDAYGRLVKVIENNKGSQYITTYQWNDLGKLTLITDAQNNTRSFTYDMLGRQLTSQDLQSGYLINYGRGFYTYTYDDVGNLKKKETPAGRVIIYTYDDINRPLTETATAPEAQTQTTTYTYDTCQYSSGIRNACTVTKKNGDTITYSEKNSFYRDGSLKIQAKKIAGEPFTTAYTYNQLGNVVTLTNADGGVTTYTYGAGGQIDSISLKSTPAGAVQTIVTNADYAPTGAVSLIEYGNNTKTINSYDEAQLYRLTLKRTVSNSLLPAQPFATTSDAVAAASPISTGVQVDFKPTPAYNLTRVPSFFSAVYYDTDPTATTTAGWYQIQLATSTDFATSSMVWDSGKTQITSTSVTQGSRILMQYLGPNTLPLNTNIYIRVKSWNNLDAAGAWSSGLDVMSFTPSYHDIQTIDYQYDPVGNIKLIRRLNPTGGVQRHIEEFTYDDVYRLERVERYLTDGLQINVYTKTWIYDAINNIREEVTRTNFGSLVTRKTYSYNVIQRMPSLGVTPCAFIGENNCTSPHSPVTITTETTDYSSGTPVDLPTQVTDMWYDRDGNTVNVFSTETGWDRYSWTPTGDLAQAKHVALDRISSSTANYLYDPSGTRIQTKSTNSANVTTLTFYPSRFLNVARSDTNTLGTTTSHIFLGSSMVSSYVAPAKSQKADINGDNVVDFGDLVILSQNYNGEASAAQGDITLDGVVDFNDLVVLSQNYNTTVTPADPKLFTASFIHTDHLGGSNVITDKNGSMRQYIDYLPFGAPFIDVVTDGGPKEQRTFTGHEFDVDTQLTYMGARYYNPQTGQFLSADPNFYTELNLSDPQSFNSYAYARNNPIMYTDPDGRKINLGLGNIFTGIGNFFAGVRDTLFGGPYIQGPSQSSGNVSNSTPAYSVKTPTLAYPMVGPTVPYGNFSNSTPMAMPHSSAPWTYQAGQMAVNAAGAALMVAPESMMVSALARMSASVGRMNTIAEGGAIVGGQLNRLLPAEAGGTRVLSIDRAMHILVGESPTQGGHMFPGNPGKTIFPQSWDGAKIINSIERVANDPLLQAVPGKYGRSVVNGTIDNVNIEVILGSPKDLDSIITGYPRY
jgi:RHS repeat-associated protein